MGTMIQGYGLTEADFRGRPYADHGRPARGLQRRAQRDAAGRDRGHPPRLPGRRADIIETNSFTATSVSLADYDLSGEARAINLAAARGARDVVDEWNRSDRRGRASSAGRSARPTRARRCRPT
jgi:5-methyltetrahydrofolate--homocysteine methyltransferase